MYYHEKQNTVNTNVYIYILVDLADFRCLSVNEAAILSEVGYVPMQQRLDDAQAILNSLPRMHDLAV